MSRESKILISILVAVVVVMIGLFAIANQGSNNTEARVDHDTLVKASSHKNGTGTIEVVEFGDYQCPACGAAHPWVQKILKDYDGKLTFIFRNFPLTNLHPNALIGANAAEAAAEQGKFWQMHDKLYEAQNEWASLAKDAAAAKFGEYATALGIDGAKVKQAATDQTYKDRITADQNDGTTLEVNATPTFYVDGRKVTASGEQGVRDAINAALKAKK